MKNKQIFDYRDYKAYVREALASRPAKGRGEKAKLAKGMNSQAAFVSQVLHGKSDLSLEQACLANDYFGHTKEEASYFLLLVQFGRAGSEKLRAHVREQLEEIDRRRLDVKNRVGEQVELTLEKQSVYYSHWLYTAIDTATSIPGLDTRDALAAYFRVPPAEIRQCLEFLLESGLLAEEGGRLKSGLAHIFLPPNSPLVQRHHANWRLKALQSLPPVPNENEMNYSMVGSISEADAKAVRKLLIDAIERINSIYRPSKEEKLFAVGMDFFEVK